MPLEIFDSPRSTTLLPFSLWSAQGPEAGVLAQQALPHLRQWLTQSQRVAVAVDAPTEPLLATLTPPHERAWGQLLGWPMVDGGLPWAARAAAEQGLAAIQAHSGTPHQAPETHTNSASPVLPSAWAFISLCNWHVSNGQVTLGDPAHLALDADTDALLFKAMQPFFAEDGIDLFFYKPGQWLARSPLFAELRTASLDRVIGRNIDPWLVGCETGAERLSPAAQLVRRLQNEMQMLLYTHSVNDNRRLTINSFWVHGTGALPDAKLVRQAPTVVQTLRSSALQQDFIGWLEAWQAVDAEVIAPLLARVAAGEPQRLVLCGEHEFQVYDSAAPTLWQRVRQRFAPISLDTVLAVEPLKD
ncbi:hypothetical protein MCEMAEM4_03057 [Burkholderiaceae bacterium]